MTGPDYDGRVFRPAGDGRTTVRGHYHQRGDLVWAEFSGDSIRAGNLVGTCADDGTLTAAYCQIHADGDVIAGQVTSRPDSLPDGRLMLVEHWRRCDGSRGESRIEEVRP